MPRVIFHRFDGSTAVVDVPAGTSVMRAALLNDVPGIVGECGGQAMCATCHVYVEDAYTAFLPPLGDDEDEMLECTATARDGIRSRLGCQLALGDELDEIAVRLPESQV
jgi:ferredoxin, 2Fe-2S